jgi:hypothetical protein
VAVTVDLAGAEKSRYVRAMFTRIAERYDLNEPADDGGPRPRVARGGGEGDHRGARRLVLDLATGTRTSRWRSPACPRTAGSSAPISPRAC